MELTSKDGNMVVDFYPVKNWGGDLINNRMLKVLSFRGDMQKLDMVIVYLVLIQMEVINHV